MRSLWTGSIAFGLINIPVKVYSASEERALKFHMLDKHGHCPISYMKVCRGTHTEVPYEDIVKGYEYQKGDYVILTDEDFAKAAPKKTKTIEIHSFVPEDEIPSENIVKPYFLEPDERSEKAYVLLREAMKRAKTVAVASWVLREKEHVVMIRPEDRALMLIELRYQDELRKPEGLDLPKGAASGKEIDLALSLIKQLQSHWNAAEYKDTYAEDLKKIIAAKAKGKKTVRVEGEEAPAPTDMRDLMEALRKSLESEKRSGHASSSRPRARAKAAA